MYIGEENHEAVTTTQRVDGAVGVQKKWYAAFVSMPRSEKKCQERLEKAGYECYVASQKELHHWANGKKRWVEVVKITGIVFVHATEEERREIVKMPYITSYLINRAGKINAAGGHEPAVIPDNQMRQLRFMLYQSEDPVHFVGSQFTLGDEVEVMRGALAGLYGQVVSIKGETEKYVGIQLGTLGCAVLRVPAEDIKKR